MKKTERHKIILNEVHLHNRVLLSDLKNIMNVSIDTVRRDLIELDKSKQLKKVHGGAISNGFNIQSDQNREIYEYENKTIIAKKAISCLNHGNVVLITGGSTNLELAKLLPKKMNLTVFTPSLPMAIELLNNSSTFNDIHLIGGKLSKGSQLATGGSSINTLSDISADICFLGTGYVDIDKGISEIDWEIAQMKKAMINSSKKVISLSISKKLNTANRYKVCNIQQVNTLITELDPSNEDLKNYKKAGLELL
ncbi:DeoR/GlpR family DNA-binding transcription regulator [Zunongwangia sp.]|uniref:DeoR/GlpR family DNA-binding transcription regulator n=1 Tax=Zunongwangia sp. TaxID=1965325 RepID=UPI003AA84E67